MIKWEDNFIKTDADSCWNWIGPKHRQGYGMCQRSIAEIQMRLTWSQVADQPEIGSEGSHQ